MDLLTYTILGQKGRTFNWLLACEDNNEWKILCKLPVELHHAIKQKHCGMLTHGIWLPHGNAPVHKYMTDQQAVCYCRFTPSLQSRPCPKWLLSVLKSYLRGQRYQYDESLKTAVDNWLKEQSEEFYFAGTASLQQKWRKCVELEKEKILKNDSLLSVVRYCFVL